MSEQKTIAFFPEGAFGPALDSVGIARRTARGRRRACWTDYWSSPSRVVAGRFRGAGVRRPGTLFDRAGSWGHGAASKPARTGEGSGIGCRSPSTPTVAFEGGSLNNGRGMRIRGH